jgi:hypothetical protein
MVAYAQVCLHSWTLVPCMSIPSDALRRHARRGNEPPSRRLYDLFSSRILQQPPSWTLTLLEPDLGHFLGYPYDPPQYEASSLAFFYATRPTSLCRPIQSSDSTTAAGEATISSTPQLLSTWSFGGSGTGLGIGIFYLFYLSLRLLRTPPTPAFLPRTQRESKYSKACRETLSTRSRSHLCLIFSLFLFLFLSVTTPY